MIEIGKDNDSTPNMVNIKEEKKPKEEEKPKDLADLEDQPLVAASSPRRWSSGTIAPTRTFWMP